jgi:hypothetical protein
LTVHITRLPLGGKERERGLPDLIFFFFVFWGGGRRNCGDYSRAILRAIFLRTLGAFSIHFSCMVDDLGRWGKRYAVAAVVDVVARVALNYEMVLVVSLKGLQGFDVMF